MFNKIILIGRLTREVDLKYLSSGTAVAKFTLAVDRRPGKNGEKEADFIDIVTWQKTAEMCAQYLNKGRLVAVEGRLQIRPYTDKQEVKRKAAEVVADQVKFLDKAKDGGAQSSRDDFASEVPFSDEDMPF